jgi:hypothetical protein
MAQLSYPFSNWFTKKFVEKSLKEKIIDSGLEV